MPIGGWDRTYIWVATRYTRRLPTVLNRRLEEISSQEASKVLPAEAMIPAGLVPEATSSSWLSCVPADYRNGITVVAVAAAAAAAECFVGARAAKKTMSGS